MEYVIVTYPTNRFVYVDGEKGGITNDVRRVSEGTHEFVLGNLKNYEPASREVEVEGTTVEGGSYTSRETGLGVLNGGSWVGGNKGFEVVLPSFTNAEAEVCCDEDAVFLSIAADVAEAEEGEIVCMLTGFGGVGREGDLG